MQRNIELPPLHNKRAPEQWKIINKHVDFEGKSVLDLGCGYADLLWRCWRAGAGAISGVDNDADVFVGVCDRMGVSPLFICFYQTDIGWFVNKELCVQYDVILCFSVLPYLGDIPATLRWIHDHSRLALIECQTYSDGPGPEWHKTDNDMRHLLERTGWTSINRIGATHVADRDKWRSIWLCEGKSTQEAL